MRDDKMSNVKSQMSNVLNPQPQTPNSELRRYIYSTNGNAMVLAVSISVILFIAMLAGVLLIRQQTNLVVGSKRKSVALSVAEAGLDAAIWRLEKNQTLPSGFTEYNTQGSYTVSITQPNASDDYHYVIASIGQDIDSGQRRRVSQDVYYVNLSRSVFSYSGTSGQGGTIEGNVNIRGPFYTGGNLSLSGNVGIYNLDNTTGNPLMIRGNLTLGGSARVGGNSAQLGPNSPMAVFVKGTINDETKVDDIISRQVPEVSLPSIVRSQYLDAAQANSNAVWQGSLTLGNQNPLQFGARGDGTYVFDYSGSGSTAALKIDGVVYIDGDLIFNKATTYEQVVTDNKKATIFVNGKIIINDKLVAKVQSNYPVNSVLALVNEDQAPLVASGTPSEDTYDVKVYATGTNSPIQAFIFTSGQITISRQPTITGSIMCYRLWLTQVPTLIVPSEGVTSNYPLLYPGKDLAFVITTNWREVSP